MYPLCTNPQVDGLLPAWVQVWVELWVPMGVPMLLPRCIMNCVAESLVQLRCVDVGQLITWC